MAGHGFAIVDSNQRVSTRSYAEHAAIGSVAVRTTRVGRGKIVTESRLLGDAAPISEVSAGNGVLYVPFVGPTIRDTAIIDLFLLPTGAYWLTLTVPHPVRRIAIARRRVFVASYQRGVPVVVGYAVQELR
jgi:hypothetical protein